MRKITAFVLCGALLMSASAMAQQKKKAAPAPAPAAKKPMIEKADESVSGQGHGMAGCGLGSVVFGTKKGMTQIFASTTNGTFGSQTFGITTGTSNCKTTDSSSKEASLFITVNRETLAKDISRGNGESLSALSEIVGCQDAALLGRKLQENYRSVFPAASATGEQSGQAVFDIIKNDEQLSRSCVKVG